MQPSSSESVKLRHGTPLRQVGQVAKGAAGSSGLSRPVGGKQHNPHKGADPETQPSWQGRSWLCTHPLGFPLRMGKEQRTAWLAECLLSELCAMPELQAGVSRLPSPWGDSRTSVCG